MAVALETEISQGSIIGRALELLGSGVPQESVASTLGVSPSYISQLLSDKDFAERVTALKYTALTKHTKRDNSYDELEDKLLIKVNEVLPRLFRPMDIMRALKTVNEARRRGVDTGDSLVPQQNIVEITIPTMIVKQFTTNIKNQVIVAGGQDLTTIQSGDLLKSVEGKATEIPEAIELEDDTIDTTTSKTKELKPLNLLENNMILDSL